MYYMCVCQYRRSFCEEGKMIVWCSIVLQESVDIPHHAGCTTFCIEIVILFVNCRVEGGKG